MANYMTMVFDPSAQNIYYGMKQHPYFPNFKGHIMDMEKRLDTILDLNNFTFVDLLDAVAVR